MAHQTHHHIVRKSIRALILSTAAVVTLSACAATSTPASITSPSDENSTQGQTMMAEYGFEGLDAHQIIDSLDALPVAERSSEYTASIRPDALVITGADAVQETIPMPDDEFYVSFAPYIDQTHDCFFHSLTTCAGELQNADIEVSVTDSDTGEVLVDEARTTFDNGFVGVWLPRGINASVTIRYEDLVATTDISTSAEDDATCVTTMQLA